MADASHSRVRRRRRTPYLLVIGAVALMVSALFGAAVPATAARASVPAGPAGPQNAGQRWAALKAVLSGIKGQWTNQDYTGAVSDIMPQTALLGNGDVGVTSGGSTGVKTFYVSKGNFWDGNPTPEPAALGGVTLRSSIPAAGSDLALGAVATASSTDGSFVPENAVNGEWTAGYQGWVSGVGAAQWIELDLGSVQSIGRFIMKNDNAARPGNAANNTSGFQVQTSTDGVNWTTVDTITGNTADIIDQALPSPVSTRYIRFYVTAPTQADTPATIASPQARIGQIQLYAPSDDPNLALGAEATASSVDDPYTPDRAVSGNWVANQGYQGWVSNVGKPQWIELNLGSVQTISRFVLYNDDAARPGNQDYNTKDVTFQTSTDGVNWTDVDSVTGNTGDIIDGDITPVQTQYVRFYIETPTQETTTDSIQNPRGRIGQIQLFPLPKTQEDPDAPPTTPPGPFSEQEDIVNARVKTSMEIDGTPLSMSTWLAPSKDVLVTSVTSDGTTPVELQSQTWSGAAGSQNSSYTNTAGTSGDVMWATRTTAPGSNWVSQASLATRLLGGSDTGTPRTVGSTAETDFTLNPGQTAQIVTAVAGGGENPQSTEAPAASLVSAQTPRTVAGLAAADTAWWKNYWMQSSISVPDPTLMRYYYAAQYFIGSASKPGDLAPALYGLWTTTDTPEFYGDYHQNYNAVAPFYGVYSSNRPELALPYFSVVDSYIAQGQVNAQKYLTTIEPTYLDSQFPSGGVPAGSSGVLYPVGIGPYGSTTAETSTGTPQFWQQTVDALFNASQYAAYWDYTRNTTFLKNEAMPYLSDVADFWQYYLQKDPSTGQYYFYSGPQETTWGENSSPDLGMLKQTLQTLIAGVNALGRQADPAWIKADPTWREILEHLPPAPTTDYNGTTAYSLVEPGTMVAAASGGNGSDIHPGDNTVNLEFVAPGNQIGINSPESEKQTVINTLNVMNSWGQSNSFVKVFTQAAQVGYPAQQLISDLDTQIQNGTVANLNVSDGNNGLEKVGTTAAINDMLVQSSAGMIDLFPDWPTSDNASFYHLLTQGAFEVSSALSGGQVQYAAITSEAGGPLRLQDAWAGQRLSVTTAHGAPVPYVVRDGAIEFGTHAGQTYQIAPVPAGQR
jgi:alpha-L-fucosidase 2